ncbi:MAG: cytochrome P450 [Puniceicoccaceae bacterium]
MSEPGQRNEMPSDARPTGEIPFYTPEGSVDGSADKAFAGDPTHVFLEGYRKHGPVFRVKLFGREQIAMGGLEANAFTWKNHDLWDYYRTNRHFREQFSDRYLNQLEGKPYNEKRRRMMQGFKPQLLMAHTDAMSEAVFEEIEQLPDGVADLRIFCMRVMIAMISRVLIQKKLPAGMDETMAISNKEMLISSSLGWKRWFWYWYPPKRWRRRKVFTFLGSILDEREKNQEPEKEDILGAVLKARDPNAPPIPRDELVHDLSQLFMAGSTTSSMIVAWSLIHTFLDPDWLGELRAELNDWDPFAFRSIDPFPKLRATTLEIERLRPGVPVFNRMTARAFEFGGYSIPAGVDVLHLHTLAHFLPEVYDDPDRFRPARFLENPNLPPKDAHGTFGGGLHKCLGSPLARIQPPLFTANVVSRYDLEFLTKPSLKCKYDAVVAPAEEPLKVRFHKRN